MADSETNGVATAALVCGLISFVLTIGLYPLMLLLDQIKTDIPEPWQTIGGLYMPLAGVLALAAIGLGIAGRIKKRQRQRSATIGLLLGIASIGMFVVIGCVLIAHQDS